MANRYWVGGTDTWNATAGSKWATTSGGAGGASVPGVGDDVFFDGNSGASTITIGAAPGNCKNIDFTGFVGTFNISSFGLGIYGALTLSATMTLITNGGGAIAFYATSGTNVITTAGKSFACTITFDGVSGTWQLADNLVLTGDIVLTNGAFDANNFNVTCSTFDSNNANVRTITMGSGTWRMIGSGTPWNLQTTTNLTFNCDTSTLKFTRSGGTTAFFQGGGLTYYNFWNATTGGGALEIQGSNTFNDLKIEPGSFLNVLGVTTQTFTTLTVNGTSANNITIGSANAVAYNFSCAAGIITAKYCNISYSLAAGGATFNAQNSFDGGNNTGWNFANTVEYLVIGGGGGGAKDANAGGGGGAGERKTGSGKSVNAAAYSITIGGGGAGGTNPSNGSSSIFDNLTAIGGGGGGSDAGTPAGKTGASGGGSGGASGNAGGTGTAGNNGGANIGGSAAGGGGGAGGVGGAPAGAGFGGNGGNGVIDSWDTPTGRVAGGGGGVVSGIGGSSGNSGGGGSGATGAVNAGNGVANTGGGGGGSCTGTAGNGGSGIVRIRFLINGSTGISTSSTGGTITQSGGYQIHTFTTNGTFTPVFKPLASSKNFLALL